MRKRKAKTATLATKMVVMKAKGESLKTHRRQKIAPDCAPYMLHIRSALGDIYLLLINRDIAKKQLLKTVSIIII